MRCSPRIILAVVWSGVSLALPVGPNSPNQNNSAAVGPAPLRNQNNSTWQCLADDSAPVTDLKCFWLSFSPADSHYAAHDACLSFGGGLASIDSKAENSFVQNLLPEDVRGAWIGLRKESNGNWRWVIDGSTPSFSNWNRSEAFSGRSCGLLTSEDATWVNADCDDSDKYYVCASSQIKTPPAVAPPPLPSPTPTSEEVEQTSQHQEFRERAREKVYPIGRMLAALMGGLSLLSVLYIAATVLPQKCRRPPPEMAEMVPGQGQPSAPLWAEVSIDNSQTITPGENEEVVRQRGILLEPLTACEEQLVNEEEEPGGSVAPPPVVVCRNDTG